MPHPEHSIAWRPAAQRRWKPELVIVTTGSSRGSQTGLAACKLVQPLGKRFGSSVKLKINMPGDSAISLLGINPDENVFMCTRRCFRECS